ncbi:MULTISPECIES: LysE family transporter [unclassified Mycolicibacterium]|uniref:LysE family transporter n=1 Tax=unclassified Mycolicibacterium TaxID=2636767 RepID=UPI002EDA13AD|nr:LysE family transporter [Mycobacterium sp.]
MTGHALIGYIGIVLLLTITPGPDTAIVLRNAIRHGTAAGISTTAGSATGLLLWAAAATLGLAALLSVSAHLRPH